MIDKIVMKLQLLLNVLDSISLLFYLHLTANRGSCAPIFSISSYILDNTNKSKQ